MNDLQRTLMTVSCRDCDAIPKTPEAGRTSTIGNECVQFMHNGVKVVHGGYHGDWMAQVIRALRGHHEPQEELIFHTLMRYVRNRSLIVELGAFWGYYTQWYLHEIPGSRAICVEPDPSNAKIGRRNAFLNATTDRINFVDAWIGGTAATSHAAAGESTGTMLELPMLDAAAVIAYGGGDAIELLHLDTQGAELPFLQSIAPEARGQLRFVMVSTHHSSISGSVTTHVDCVEALRALDATVLIEHDVVESFSGDGLILASFMPEDRNLHFPEVSRNRAETSLFKTA